MIDDQPTSEKITIMLEIDDDMYCGGVLNYSTKVSPTSPQPECNQTSCIFSDLQCETTYNITVEAMYLETTMVTSSSAITTTGKLIYVPK